MARTAIAATFAASVTTLIVSGAHSADHAATSRGALPANEVPAWIPSMFETSGQTNKVLVQGRGTLSVEHQIPILHRRVIFFSLFFVPEVLFVAERRGLCLRFGSTAPPFRSLYVRCLNESRRLLSARGAKTRASRPTGKSSGMGPANCSLNLPLSRLRGPFFLAQVDRRLWQCLISFLFFRCSRSRKCKSDRNRGFSHRHRIT